MKKINWWRIDFGPHEQDELMRAFAERSLTLGRYTQKLESRLSAELKIPYVVVTNSGTSALTMALLVLGIKSGDEVLVPNITWIATAQAGAVLGAKVIPVDTLPDLPIMDLEDLKSKITNRTRAVIPVHYNGRDSNVSYIRDLGKKHGFHLIEDSCKAMFSSNRCISGGDFLGTYGDMGCFSMGMISLVPACFGGFVVTHNRDIYERLRIIRWHGVDTSSGEDYRFLALNFKYSDLLASLASSHLESRLNKIERLRKVYATYCDGLKNLEHLKMIPVAVEEGEVPLLIDVRSKHRDRIRAYLNSNGIETCNFHPPIHLAPYLSGAGGYPNSTSLACESFHLPCGPDQPLASIERCIELLQSFKI